jgi:coenzyme F420-reducing hydrogenase alpha subunit
MTDLNIHIHHVTRLEGHGDIIVNARNGKIEKIQLNIVEAPRFFESMLRGRRHDEAVHLSCRICGICSGAHTNASLTAMEAALGIEPSEQTVLLRKLIMNAEQLESHVLHVYFLAAPDFFNVGSVIPLAATHPDVVKRALKLKRLANFVFETIGGQHVHLRSALPKAFTYVPTVGELREMKSRFDEAWDDILATVDLAATLPFPSFQRETEYVCIKHPGEYAFYQGDIVSTDDPKPTRPADYRSRIFETVVDYSPAKHTRSPNRDAYMVGALARFNNNFGQLHDSARAAAKKLGLKPPVRNPFLITAAQVVESVHVMDDTRRILDRLLSARLALEDRTYPLRAGRGVGLVEAPRGLLMHEYVVDAKGYITDSNLIIPTNQNQANIEADMRKLVPEIIDRPQEEIAHLLEMLLRAYDPCISCATHALRVEFV